MPDPAPNLSFRILNVTEINETPRPVHIKEEPVDPAVPVPIPTQQSLPDTQLEETQAPDPPVDPTTASTSNSADPPVKVKEEPKEGATPKDPPKPTPEDPPKPTPVQKPTSAIADVKVEVSAPVAVPPGRPCCRFGVKCYRKNASHRDMECHPGDVDYKLPDYPPPPSGTLQCPYGATCYRRNPAHFQQLSHSGSPPSEYNRLELIIADLDLGVKLGFCLY